MAKQDLAVLLGVPKRAKEDDDAGVSRKDFARDILDAIKDDDAEALALALQGFNGATDDDDTEEE